MAARSAKWQPEPEQRNMVASLAAFGMPLDEQVLMVKGPDGRALTVEEFAEVYAEELSSGRAKANAQLGLALYQRAMGGDTRALREWQKQAVSETVGLRELADWIGVSTALITTMERRGVIRKTSHGLYPLRESLAAAFAHYREMAAGRGNAEGTLTAMRGRLALAQAEAIERKNAYERGELISVSEAVAFISEHNLMVVTRILAIPAEAAPQLHACRSPVELQAMLSAQLCEALDGLSSEFGKPYAEAQSRTPVRK